MPQGIWGCPEGALTGAVPADLRLINTQAIFAHKTGMIILGGGLVKHHIANANLMVRGAPGWGGGVGPRGGEGSRGSPRCRPRQRNGADFSVYVNTAQEFDGSDSGARPDEAVSWGKIRVDASPVKVGGPGGSRGGCGGHRVRVFPPDPLPWARSMPTPRSCSRCSWPRRLPGAPTPSRCPRGPPRPEGPPWARLWGC